MLLLNPEQQAGVIEDAPEIFCRFRTSGANREPRWCAWLTLKVKPEILEGALRTAWTNRQRRSAKPLKKRPA